MAVRTYTFGVKFRKSFSMAMLAKQSGMDRFVHNKLLDTFREEYRRTGRVNTTRGRINAWYTDLRNQTGPHWLRQSVSLVTRQTLIDLGRHYEQYVETEHLKAAGITPETEWGEPHFKRHSDRVSIPLNITQGNGGGTARFTGERSIRIYKMGDILLSRPFPVLNYRPKTARLFQLPDGGWRITVACGVPDERPPVTEPTVIGADRNVGNVATPTCLIVVPEKMERRMVNAERTAKRAQKNLARRQKPTAEQPGSNRWKSEKKRVAKNRRRGANIRKTTAHKTSRVIADSCTHAGLEKLKIKNLTKSAKGTVENPGKNVKQKSGLNKSILGQSWGLLAFLLAYKLAGGIIWVVAAYTSQKCCPCGYVHKENRHGRRFRCRKCGHSDHADCNAGANIENAGLEKLGPKARRGRLKLRDNSPVISGSSHVKGSLDVEGSGVGLPAKRQAPTGGRGPRTVVLWRDV